MNKRTKRMIIVVVAGGCIGIILTIAGGVFQLPKLLVMEALLTAYIIFVAVTMLYNTKAINKFNKKVRELTSILLEEQDIEGYLKACTTFLEETKNYGLKVIIMMNRSVAYIHLGEYEKANEILLSVDETALVKSNRAVLYNNIAFNYFMSGEISRGCEMMDKYKLEMDRCIKMATARSSLFMTYALWRFAIGDRNGGFVYLDEAEKYALQATERQGIQVIRARELIQRDRKEEAETILHQLSHERIMPGVSKEVHRLLDIINRTEEDNKGFFMPLLLPAPK